MVEADVHLVGAVSAAYRRAACLALPVVSTDLVLFYAVGRSSLMERHVPHVVDTLWRPVWEGQSGLADPDPPATPRFAPVFDNEVSRQTDTVLRLAADDATTPARLRAIRARHPERLPTYSPAVRFAVITALHEAGRAGLAFAGPLHLIVGLLAVPRGAAGQVMKRLTDEDWEPGSPQVVRLAQTAARSRDRTAAETVESLIAIRVLPPVRPVPRLRGLPWQAATWWTEQRQFRRPYRRHGAMYGHPLLEVIQSEATRHAVLGGDDVVTAAHVLIGVLELHEQLTAAGWTLPEPVARWNSAGQIVARHGVTLLAAARAAAEMPEGLVDDEDRLEDLPTRGWPASRDSLVARVHGRTAWAALRGASLSAHRLGHPYAGTSHLLVELLAEPAGPAARLLRHLQVDPEAVRAEARRSLQPIRTDALRS